MTSTQLTEEQLQQSAILSDEDIELNDAHTEPVRDRSKYTDSPLTNLNIQDGDISDATRGGNEEQDGDVVEDEMEVEEHTDEQSDLSDGESIEDVDRHSDEDGNPGLDPDHGDDCSAGHRSRSSSLLDDIDEDEAEGVGAVKIRPGETDDEVEEPDSEHSDSLSESANESDGAAEWEDAAAGEEEEEEEVSDDAEPNTCVFCKQDEEHDPGEEFEEYLSCVECGEGCKFHPKPMKLNKGLTEPAAHQHCAREAGALEHPNIPAVLPWRCPQCSGKDSPDNATLGHSAHEAAAESQLSPSSRRSTASQVARDLLPPQKGAPKPDSHSVFNQLVLDADPLDGSRILRKRKTSSVEADDMAMSLRKRRRNTPKERESSNGVGTPQEILIGQRDQDSRRKLRLNPTRKTQAVTITRRHRSTVVKMRVKPSALRRVLSRKGVSTRKKTGRLDTAPASCALTASGSGSFTSTDYSHPFYSFFDRETDEMKAKPYGGILTEIEADTSRTLPTNDDRRRFDEAKQKSEEIWRARLQSVQLHHGTPAKRSKKNAGPASQIECIDFGGWEIDTWYAAPYPEEYSRNRTLYICEFCLKYMNSDYVAWRHKLKCPAKHPPGDEIYRFGSVSVFEVDGRKNPVYCQNLCLLAKLFLGSKTLYYDVEPFLFYVLCEYDALGYHFVGYFSKEKRASSQNNVSCILTLPIHQRKGYGNLLIDFSYLLTRVERKTGSPEKPLSDMGLVSYRNYWRLVLCRYLLDNISEGNATMTGLSVRQISDDTGLTPDDVISALEGLRCLVRDPHTELYAFRVDLAYCNEYISKWERKNYVKLNPDALTWTPYVMGRGNATNFELGPAISAIAPREEDESHRAPGETLPPTCALETVLSGDVDKDTADKPVVNGGNTFSAADAAESESGGLKAQEDVYQSTESHHEIHAECGSTHEAVHEDAPQPSQETQPSSVQPVNEDWASLYKDVPPSRFEVYPPPGGRRSDRPRPSVPRPAVARSTSNSSRPRRLTGGGSARRPTASRPKNSSSSSRRKTGGTGRGPGRWPKGTKKSDYGNADSGPGLPPAWIRERQRATLGANNGVKDEDIVMESKESIDVVRVHLEHGAQAGAGTDSIVGGGGSGDQEDGHGEGVENGHTEAE